MEQVVCKEVIVSNIQRRGKGTPESPIRIITQVFEKDGTLIAEHDPCSKSLDRAIEANNFLVVALNSYLNAGSKEARTKASIIAKQAIEESKRIIN